MGEKIVSVITKDGRKISIEEYYALENKAQVSVLYLIFDTGVQYSIEGKKINMFFEKGNAKGTILFDKTGSLFVAINGEGEGIGVSESEGITKFMKQILQTSLTDLDTNAEVQEFINQKGFEQAVSYYKECIERFKPIAGQNITLKQLKTFIETGNLFETPEERKEYEAILQEKMQKKEERKNQLSKINEEISKVEARLAELNKQKDSLVAEDKAEAHAERMEL